MQKVQRVATISESPISTINDIIRSRVEAQASHKNAVKAKYEAIELAYSENQRVKAVRRDTNEQLVDLALDGRFIKNTALFNPSISYSMRYRNRDNLSEVENRWIAKADALTKAMSEMMEAKEALLADYANNPNAERNININIDVAKLSAMTGAYLPKD